VITVYTIVCETHDQAGPELTSRPEAAEMVDGEEWSRFLREHERCDLRLSHE
jgi:hypothetical protein